MQASRARAARPPCPLRAPSCLRQGGLLRPYAAVVLACAASDLPPAGWTGASLSDPAGIMRALAGPAAHPHAPCFPPARLSAVAEAIVQSLLLDFVEGQKYAIISRQGEGPGQDPAKWRTLFASLQPAGVA